MATQLLAASARRQVSEVPFLSFFDTPTVAEMAGSRRPAGCARSQAVPLQPVPRGGPLPLSYAQQRLWFLGQLGLTGHAYHLLEVLLLRGPLQATALAQSLREMSSAMRSCARFYQCRRSAMSGH